MQTLKLITSPYDTIYDALAGVREAFHRGGRIADANAKLDETVKLMAIHHAIHVGQLNPKLYESLANRSTFNIAQLNLALGEAAAFFDGEEKGGPSIFGANPQVAFEEDEAELAFDLFRFAGAAVDAQLSAEDPLDVVNEAFGHHVRDNFRSNTEDAQYMTPPEVVDLMVALAIEVFSFKSSEPNQEYVVCDPSCGVGSFLTSWHRQAELARRRGVRLGHSSAVGQDKVGRMARLAKANLTFSGFPADKIYVGNSLHDGSPLSDYDGKVDLILTNPPFGARFATDELARQSSKSLPEFSSARFHKKQFDSEVVFLERYLSLLKPGGLCFAVVPDGIVSAKGGAAIARHLISRQAKLLAVIEMPPETFAQAGTRTKTSIIAFQKGTAPEKEAEVFFAEANSLGFKVTKRKGVTVKKVRGSNELPCVLEAFKSHKSIASFGEADSFAEWVSVDISALDAWTPRRFRQIAGSTSGLPTGVTWKERRLGELVKPREKVRPQKYRPGSIFISVLHVIGEGLLDLPGALSYRPITPGAPIKPGQVIISRLNPRIPRVLVVPDLSAPLLCSTEFEVLEPREGISAHALALVLLSGAAQSTLATLTAGTSASHSRVRPDAIREMTVPWPEESNLAFDSAVADYRDASEAIISGIRRISEIRSAGE